MDLQDLRLLLDYHYWARDRVLNAVATLGHLYGAEHAWHQRWRGTSPTALLPADRFGDVASLRDAWIELERKVRGFVDDLGEAGVAQVFEYRMLSGAPGASPFWEMLQHVVNHGSYHRGQVTTMLRQLGAEPSRSMDLIAFHRDRAGAQA